jgi:hypothetical protein
MRHVTVLTPLVLIVVGGIGAATDDPAAVPPAADMEFSLQVSRLVAQLNDDAADRRDAAERQLLDLAGASAASVDRFVATLPPDSDQMPLAIRERLKQIRRQVEVRAAKAAVDVTTVTLSADRMPLTEILTAIEKQTGNRLLDHRQLASDDSVAPPKLTVNFKGVSFWDALDQVLDQANLGIYNYAGDDALAVVDREAGDGSRRVAAVYSGPFRLEVLDILAQQSLRKADRKSLKLQLEVAWEPRLRPIAVTQEATEVTATDEAGHKLAATAPDAELDAEIPVGTQATELALPFDLPERRVTKIASLKGKVRALVPGRQVKFSFDDLVRAGGKSQESGGVHVSIDSVRKNNEVWEIHMRLRLDEDNRALESHRSWAFQNLSYLLDKDGKRIENAGLETTLQTKNEVGVAYFFDPPGGLDGLTWIYETPAAIVELPVEYEFKDIPLP